MGRILIVDDDSSLRQAVSVLLTRHGCEVACAAGGREALELLTNGRFDVVITDLKMEKMSGLDLLRKIRAGFPEVEVILLTAYGSIPTAVEAMRAQAFDYVTKPFRNEELLVVVDKALERRMLVSEVKYLREVVDYKYNFGTIVGESPAIRRLTELVAKAARMDTPVLISGEPGTGKELIAKTIHDNSSRRNRKFVAVNCSAIPEDILDSELFGNSIDDSPGTQSGRTGLLDRAEGGTILLDDIVDVNTELQSRILSFLDRKTIYPTSSKEDGKSDARVIAATRYNPDDAVRRHGLLESLCSRLSAVRVELPRLADRGEDVLLLAEHFIRKYAREFGRQPATLTPDAAKTLLRHSWPGNVRELENTMKRTVALIRGDIIRREDLLMLSGGSEGAHRVVFKSQTDKGMSLKDKELEFIVRTLRDNNWNYTRTARQLGIGRTTLWRKMKKMKTEDKHQAEVPATDQAVRS